jgi:hypothetical protein
MGVLVEQSGQVVMTGTLKPRLTEKRKMTRARVRENAKMAPGVPAPWERIRVAGGTLGFLAAEAQNSHRQAAAKHHPSARLRNGAFRLGINLDAFRIQAACR